MKERTRWGVVLAAVAAVAGLVLWLLTAGAPLVRFTVRLYSDNAFLKDTVAAWGWAAPIIFIAIQALQVIISPIPGEITGPVGGALFGTWWGVAYSTVGLTAGTLFCFWLGRAYGEPLVRPWLSEHHWNRMSFIVEAEGAIFCFIIYLIPGFPKDIVSYLFGISPIPFWAFAVVSTVGRLPGTWVSSYVGAHVVEHKFIYVFLLLALVAAVSLPLYYYRRQIAAYFHRAGGRGPAGATSAATRGLTRSEPDS